MRIDEGDFLRQRAKIVRPDFIAGDEEHWSKGRVTRNTVVGHTLG